MCMYQHMLETFVMSAIATTTLIGCGYILIVVVVKRELQMPPLPACFVGDDCGVNSIVRCVLRPALYVHMI